MERLFDTSWTYECGALDYASLPNENVEVNVLGKSFNAVQDRAALIACCQNFLWLTYRKSLQPICESQLTSDQGWGCMHRSGQMLLSNLLLRILNNNSLPYCAATNSTTDSVLADILSLFVDNPTSLFSIHSVAAEAFKMFDKKPGEWLGPNAVCQVLKQLFETGGRPLVPDLYLHVCRDGICIMDEILSLIDESSKCNRKLFLMMPLRLGIVDLSSQYFPSLQQVMRMRQFAGLVGGKPNHASWFFGFMQVSGNEELLCLDPHTTQPFVDPFQSNDYSSYHCSYITRIPLANLDPSLALTFYCDSKDCFLQLCSELQDIFKKDPSAALFDVVQEMPAAISSSMADWPLTSSDESSTDGGFHVGDDFEVI